MHIAHFIQRYPPALGGSEAYFARLSRYFVGRGHRITVWTSTAIDLEAFWSPSGRVLPAGESEIDGVIVRRFAPRHWPLRRYWLKALSFVPGRKWQCLFMPCNPIAPDMYRQSRACSDRYDVVHASALPYGFPLVCAWQLAQAQSIPFWLTPFLHLGDRDAIDRTRRRYTSPALTWLMQQAQRIFVQTPSERDAVIELGIPGERVILQGLGVDAAECTGGDRAGFRANHGIGADEVLIGHLANQSVEKGTVDLLRAALMAWERGAMFRIVLAGPSMMNFRTYWQSFPHPERIIQLGVIDEPTKRDFFASIDAFALPSRSDSFGLVLLEAWANGLPNIAYRAGGVADLIQHQRDGLLVRTGDVNELASGLAEIAHRPDWRTTMGQSGRLRVEREFQWADKLAIVERELPPAALTSRPS